MAIDVGLATESFSHAWYLSPAYTWLGKDNPCNADGAVDTIQVYFRTDATGFKAGSIYYASGDSYTCRDSESIGNVTSGSVQTFTGLDIDIATGDYAGCYCTGGSLDRSSSGGAGVIRPGGAADVLNAGQSASYYVIGGSGTYAMDLYGTGQESGGATEKTSSDSGQGAEAATTALASISGGESGSGADAVTGAAAVLIVGDAGSGAESLGSRSFNTVEVGVGTEGVPAGTASLAAVDAGQGAEYAHILGLWEVLFGEDAGIGSDPLKALAASGGPDTGLRAGPGRVGIPHKEVKL